MRAFENVLDKIIEHEKKYGNSYVTIVNFTSKQRVIYERVKPTEVNMEKIQQKWVWSWGRSFNSVFEKAAKITNQNINQQTITFVFMTDGDAEYPKNWIDKFQTIMKNHPNKFIYRGILLGESSKVMNNISIALKDC